MIDQETIEGVKNIIKGKEGVKVDVNFTAQDIAMLVIGLIAAITISILLAQVIKKALRIN